MRTLLLGLALSLAVCNAHAQIAGGGRKPIRFIVDFPAGGVSDTMARIIAQRLTAVWDVPVVVDNRSGANGIIAYEAVAKAPPDGHTLGLISTGFALNVSLRSSLPYAVSDFAPVSLIATRPNVLITHPAVPAASVKELVALAKRRPGVLNYASVGIGSSPHLSGEMFKKQAHVDIVHVPYKGSGAALTDLMVGRVDLMFLTLPAALPHINAGKLRALAVTDTRRSPVLPQVPTTPEIGLPELIVIGWYGVATQAAVPAETVSRYNAEINRMLAQPDVRERIAHLGAEVRIMSPSEFAAFIREDVARGAKAIKDSGTSVTN
jgi:tripartite-type tricarboxylate transporter receptor subunit TctC